MLYEDVFMYLVNFVLDTYYVQILLEYIVSETYLICSFYLSLHAMKLWSSFYEVETDFIPLFISLIRFLVPFL